MVGKMVATFLTPTTERISLCKTDSIAYLNVPKYINRVITQWNIYAYLVITCRFNVVHSF